MHGTHTTADTLFVSGGRNTSELLTEVWSLQIIETITNTTSSSGDTITVSSPVWTRQSEMDLEFPRCAHGSCFVQNKLCAFGGFTGDGISNEIIVCNINSNESSNCGNSGNHSSITVLNTSNSNSNSNISSGRWVSVIANKEIDTRFGACMCSVSLNMLTAISNSTKYSPLFCNNSKTRINEADNSSDRSMEKFGILLFGGVSMEKDYSDVLCLLLN